jgi:polysaccharide pyruvyl transferase WcaK-like protein
MGMNPGADWRRRVERPTRASPVRRIFAADCGGRAREIQVRRLLSAGLDMRILLVNDTRGDPNVGCRATVAGLGQLLASRAGDIVATLPVGFRYEIFRPLIAAGQQHDVEAWRAAVEQLARDEQLIAQLTSVDLVVANLEGTFHHHTIGALALGGLLAVAHRRGVPVWAVNGSVQAIDPWLLAETLKPADYVAVREPMSARFLAEQGLDAVAAADGVFLIESLFRPRHAIPPAARRVLYTPGILACGGPNAAISVDETVRQLQTLSARGWQPHYLRLSAGEPLDRATLATHGLSCTEVGDVPWQAMGAYLRPFELAVSGRYHVLILAAIAGVPILALPSNSWKIEGLLELLHEPGPLVTDAGALSAWLERPRPLAPVARELVQHCLSLARQNVPATARYRSIALHEIAEPESEMTPVTIALFGASSLGRQSTTVWRGHPHVRLRGFLDNDRAKWGTDVDGLPVLAPEAAVLDEVDGILVTSMYAPAIRTQITEAGYAHKLLADASGIDRLVSERLHRLTTQAGVREDGTATARRPMETPTTAVLPR